MAAQFQWDRFDELPIIGILRGVPLGQLPPLAEAVLTGGLTAVEVTMNSADAPTQIARLRECAGGRLNVGAGTVTSLAELEQALAAGATFIVTPVLVPDVIQRCVELRVPVFPGAFTPTEIFQAWQLGAAMVKVFPANRLGPGYFHDVKAPLHKLRLLAVGGITVETVGDYARGGADGVGVGSPLFHLPRIAAGDWDWVQHQTEHFARGWREARGQPRR
jgi:2-dehydro-3-deoxyphosphogluconate aldolase/(4S)-4-hydroxy-2-oxoglutarate aldolase